MSTGAEKAFELLKILRSGPVTVTKIGKDAGWDRNTAQRYLDEGVAQGLVEMRSKASGRNGAVYALSPMWGGQACN